MPRSTAPIACSEVWGGNRAAEVALVLPGLEGWVVSRPWHGAEAGGDVHYVSSCGTGRITRLMLADVSGHGASAAAAGVQLRRLMHRYLNHIDPRKLALRMNRDLAALAGDGGGFATAVVMTFFSPDGGLSLCNAGHPPPLLYRHASKKWGTIDQPDTGRRIVNLPLGVLEESGYVGRELSLEPGDMILAYTDCLSEAQQPGGKMLGTAGLVEAINQLEGEPTQSSPAALIDALLEHLWGKGYTMDDDLTAIAVRCTARSGGVSFWRGLVGAGRSVAAVLTGRALPLPEWSVANLLGSLYRGYKRKQHR